MPGPHKGVSTQRTTQQQFAQPSERDQQARDKLRNKISESKAKIKKLCVPTVRRKSITNHTSDF